MTPAATTGVALLMTGNELMTGDIVDSNSAWMAECLSDAGLSITYKVTVADDLEVLVSELERLTGRQNLVIVNGGLGPTSDDLTAEALALAAGVGLEEHPEARLHLETLCATRGFQLSAANLKQAMLPKGCDIIANPVGTAVGFRMQLGNCRVYCTPGVPGELKHMMLQELLPDFAADVPMAQRPLRKRLGVFGYGESGLQQLLTEQFPDWPEAIELGFRASMPMLELKLQSTQEHACLLDQWTEKVAMLLGDHLVTDQMRSLPQVLVAELQASNRKFTCAESCTGGLVASLMTAISGVSEVFEAGFVTYSNKIKERVLGVSPECLKRDGAVSEVVARAMLAGALKVSGADIGLAITGVAGPGGGSEQKPVGTVWIAWGTRQRIRAAEFLIPGSRSRFQNWVAAMAMDLVRRELVGSEQIPNYVIERCKSGFYEQPQD